MILDDKRVQTIVENGFECYKDIDLVELLLSLRVDRRNYWSEAEAIFRKYKTLREVLDAPPEELKTIRGYKEHYQLGLQLPQFVANRYLEQKIKEQPCMSNSEDVIKYLTHSMRGLEYEIFKVLYLNNRGRMIANEDVSKGTVHRAEVSVREIFKSALRNNASALIFAHNHTSGDPTPSPDDLDFTDYLLSGAAYLDIAVYDHIIIGDNRYYSFHEEGIIGGSGKAKKSLDTL